MKNPFAWIRSSYRLRVCVVLFCLTLLMSGMLMVSGPPRTTDAPQGIVSFEFAGNLSQAYRILSSWGHPGQAVALLDTGLDYLFILFYVGAIGLACSLAGGRFKERTSWVASSGLWLAWGLIVAGIFDGIENFGLIQTLLGNQQEYWVRLAGWCASVKFILIGLGLLFLALCASWESALFIRRIYRSRIAARDKEGTTAS